MFPNPFHAFSASANQTNNNPLQYHHFYDWQPSAPQIQSPFFYYYNVFPLQQNSFYSLNHNLINLNSQKTADSAIEIKQPTQSAAKRDKFQKTKSKQNQMEWQLPKYQAKRNQSSKIRFTQTFQQEESIKNQVKQTQVQKRSFRNQFSNCQKQEEEKIELQAKRKIQNMRYKKKNIEANIVNRIFTYLQNCFKVKCLDQQLISNNKEKYNLYSKVLKKIQEGWKLPIKRHLIKMLVSIDESLPRYYQISKLLQKNNLAVQDFQNQTRLIVRNYLRNNIVLSILTSKKMKSENWKDHLQKAREIDRFIFGLQKTDEIQQEAADVFEVQNFQKEQILVFHT